MSLANTLPLKTSGRFHREEKSHCHHGLKAKVYGKFAPQPD